MFGIEYSLKNYINYVEKMSRKKRIDIINVDDKPH